MDRRIIWAIAAMILIAIVPSFFLKRPARPPVVQTSQPQSPADSAIRPSDTSSRISAAPVETAGEIRAGDSSAVGDTVRITSPLYEYDISTVGGRLAAITLPTYASMAALDRGKPVEILHPSSDLLGLSILSGQDTLHLDRWVFAPSVPSLNVTGPSTLTLTGSRGGVSVTLTYSFRPDAYQVGIQGQINGLGPNGGVLLVGMGPGIRNVEADSIDNYRSLGLVTENNGASATLFRKLSPGTTTTLAGPFNWVAIKAKYFVTAIFALDSTAPRITGVTATPPVTAAKSPTQATVKLSLPLGGDGRFRYTLYAGPMEYKRLTGVGHNFDDVNPYGWPGLRTVIRPVAVVVRSLLVWMHEHLHLAYGVVLICFGIMIRLILWPLNQKAMRSSMAMQGIQPQLKEIQEKYKNEPQKLQQEMFKIYKENGVNPFGGCWPLLIPMPVLFSLFFVLGNTIELRGVPFLWLPDLSRADPYYVVPVLMGLSMFVLSKVGSRGMPPNPQTKIMLYVMPIMMTVLFISFASGLNLYYAVQNTASIPQQWLLARERLRRNPQPPPAPPKIQVKSKK
ncbi:MAG: membrane protein insertase YidC [Gemmatimonadota bacterium]